MADLTYTQKATERRAAPNLAAGKGDAANIKGLTATVVAAVNTTITRQILFGKVPSNGRPLGTSTIYVDDLATAGSPTLSLGLGSVNSNITSLSTALTDSVDLATAGSAKAVKLHTSYGKRFWELAGASEDPGGLLDVYGSIIGAPTTTSGSITLDLQYVID